MKTATFIIKFLITLLLIVALFFAAVFVISIFKGVSTGDVLRAIGDASIFTSEWWTNTGVAAFGGFL